MAEQIRELRGDTRAVPTGLAKGESEAGDWTALRMQGSLSADDPVAKLHRNRDSLTFGLQEVRRALADLIEAPTTTQ